MKQNRLGINESQGGDRVLVVWSSVSSASGQSEIARHCAAAAANPLPTKG